MRLRRGPSDEPRLVRVNQAPGHATSAEIAAASICSFLATAIIASYLMFRPGLRVPPYGVLFASLVLPAAILVRARRCLLWSEPDLRAFFGIVLAAFAAVVWRSRPSLLPVGGGPDLTPHMILIDYIQEHWRLVYDPALSPYLGDMLFYTPGSHLLIALAGAWFHTDSLYVVHSVLASTVALKVGLIFLVALRILPRDVPRMPIALLAVSLLFLPLDYLLGSFMHDSFWAQVVSELFACAMWAGLAVWDAHPSASIMALVGLAGAATFVAWPIWVGPLVVTLGLLVALRDDLSWPVRARHAAAGLLPIAVVGSIHLAGRLEWLRMAAASGAVVAPSPAVFGWPFLSLGAVGVILAATRREARSAALLVAAIAIQTMALFALASIRGATTPYMAYKMMYLLIYPLAAVSSLAMAAAWRLVFVTNALPRAGAAWAAWLLVPAVFAGVVRHARLASLASPIVSSSVYQAGRWARANVAARCVDYLVVDGYTGYWLHLAVLGNPWTSPRMQDPDTFEPHKALVRWIYPDGLPFAIVDDMRMLPRDIRDNVDVLAAFETSAVVKRRGSSSCTP